MEFKKKILRESMDLESNGVKTYSENPQNIIMTESQLERLIQKLNEQEETDSEEPKLVDSCKADPNGKGCDGLFDRIKKFFVKKRRPFNFKSLDKVPPNLLSDYKKSCAAYN